MVFFYLVLSASTFAMVFLDAKYHYVRNSSVVYSIYREYCNEYA